MIHIPPSQVDRFTQAALAGCAPDLRSGRRSRAGLCWRALCRAVLFGLLGVLVVSGCKTAKTEGPPLRSAQGSNRPTILASGDVLRITFPGAPENNQSQKIRPDGKISLPLVGEVDAAGRRPFELQAELMRLYEKQLTNNQVVVTLESGAVPVYISGAVRRPGKLVFDRPTNLLEVLTESGGLAPEANLKKVRIIRVVNGVHRSQIVNLKPALSGEPSRAIYVQANDIIHVGSNFISF